MKCMSKNYYMQYLEVKKIAIKVKKVQFDRMLLQRKNYDSVTYKTLFSIMKEIDIARMSHYMYSFAFWAKKNLVILVRR